MSMSASFGRSRSSSDSNDYISRIQEPFLADMYRRAAGLSQQNTFVGADPLQKQAQDMAQQYAYNLSPFTEGAMRGGGFLTSGAVLDPSSNPYLASTAQAATRPIIQSLTENVLPAIGSEAGMTGNVGSSRQGIAEGLATQGALQAIGDTTSNLYSNAYGQGLGAMTSALQMAPQIANLGLLPSSILSGVGGERRGLAQEQMQNPFQNLSFLAQILGDPTILNSAISRSSAWNTSGSYGL